MRRLKVKQIKPSTNPEHWPRKAVKTIETRKRDLVIRIADWSKDREEPAFDVECYIGGVYDWHESESFTFYEHKTKSAAKTAAITYAQAQITKLLEDR